VQPHPDTDLRIIWPDMSRDRSLSTDGGGNRSWTVRECCEERITLGADLDAALARKGGTNELVMRCQERVIAIAELVHEARRGLDVREQERDGSCRKGGIDSGALLDVGFGSYARTRFRGAPQLLALIERQATASCGVA
jgi:hypothetical protein